MKIEKMPEWPTEEDLINIRLKWRRQGGSSGPYASFGICNDCENVSYRFGKTYENMTCFNCFLEKNRPKRRRKRKTNRSLPTTTET